MPPSRTCPSRPSHTPPRGRGHRWDLNLGLCHREVTLSALRSGRCPRGRGLSRGGSQGRQDLPVSCPAAAWPWAGTAPRSASGCFCEREVMPVRGRDTAEAPGFNRAPGDAPTPAPAHPGWHLPPGRGCPHLQNPPGAAAWLSRQADAPPGGWLLGLQPGSRTAPDPAVLLALVSM